jgi:drug/metabolite transporter (DMT)-like permease
MKVNDPIVNFKTDLFIIIITGFFNVSIGVFLLFIGLTKINDSEWSKLIHILFGLVIISYPLINLRDRINDLQKIKQ